MRVSALEPIHPANPEESIADLLEERRQRGPDAPMIEVQGANGWEPITAAQFTDSVYALAKGLIAVGVEHGDRFGIMGRTSEPWTRVDYALWCIGAAGVPVYETSSPTQTEWIITNSGMVGAIAEQPSHAEVLRPHLGEKVFVMEHGALEALEEKGRSIPDSVLAARRAAVQGSDLAAVIYTSGTTG
ncbi:MAG: AMP-binding protein, partial [Bifidobacteriaceae bacterium]|nr:AMP-binding protein [Bifidobacteriaceae bacterium]